MLRRRWWWTLLVCRKTISQRVLSGVVPHVVCAILHQKFLLDLYPRVNFPEGTYMFTLQGKCNCCLNNTNKPVRKKQLQNAGNLHRVYRITSGKYILIFTDRKDRALAGFTWHSTQVSLGLSTSMALQWQKAELDGASKLIELLA